MEDSEFTVQVMDNRLYKKQVWLESALVKLVKKQDKILNQIETLKLKESPFPPRHSPTPILCKPGTSKALEKFQQDKTPVRKSTDEVKPKSKIRKGGLKSKRKRQEENEEGEKPTEASSSSSEVPEPSSPTKFFALWDELDKIPVKKCIGPVQSKSKSKKGGAKTKNKRKASEEEDETEDSNEASNASSQCAEPSKTAELFEFCRKFDKTGASVDAMRLVIQYPKMSFVEKVHKYVHHMRQKAACDIIYKEFLVEVCERQKNEILKKSKDKEQLSS